MDGWKEGRKEEEKNGCIVVREKEEMEQDERDGGREGQTDR